MAWITPVYDRTHPVRITATDMNRIVGNIEYLDGEPIKSNYTNADIVKDDEWEYIVEFTQQKDMTITLSSSWQNFNKIEYALKRMHDGDTAWNDYIDATWNSLDITWDEMGGN